VTTGVADQSSVAHGRRDNAYTGSPGAYQMGELLLRDSQVPRARAVTGFEKTSRKACFRAVNVVADSGLRCPPQQIYGVTVNLALQRRAPLQ